MIKTIAIPIILGKNIPGKNDAGTANLSSMISKFRRHLSTINLKGFFVLLQENDKSLKTCWVNIFHIYIYINTEIKRKFLYVYVINT